MPGHPRLARRRERFVTDGTGRPPQWALRLSGLEAALTYGSFAVVAGIRAEPVAKPAPRRPGSPERAMHPWIVGEIVRLHQSDLDREAGRARLASLARTAPEDRTAHQGLTGRTDPQPRRSGERSILAGVAEVLFGRHTPHLRGH